MYVFETEKKSAINLKNPPKAKPETTQLFILDSQWKTRSSTRGGFPYFK